jgi:hypothetical protein
VRRPGIEEVIARSVPIGVAWFVADTAEDPGYRQRAEAKPRLRNDEDGQVRDVEQLVRGATDQ